MATKVRTGARSWARDIQHACKMSRIPGFRSAVIAIFGATDSADLLAAWDTFCGLVDVLVGVDDFFAQIDFHQEVAGSEDIAQE